MAKTEDKHKFFGVTTGVVTDNVCDGNAGVNGEHYRVKVKFPTDQAAGGDSPQESTWCRVATFGAGGTKKGDSKSEIARGIFWLPEPGDEVIIAFIHGDFDNPVVIGSVWNGQQVPTYDNADNKGIVTQASFQGKTEAKKNDLRVLSARCDSSKKSHQLIFNSNANEPRIALHSGQKHRIVLDDKDNQPTQIEIYDGKEENYILIDTKNKKITIESKTGDILIKAKEKIRFECKNMETKTDQATKLEVGTNYEMKASSNMTIKASGTGDIESSGTMTFKGSTVNIN